MAEKQLAAYIAAKWWKSIIEKTTKKNFSDDEQFSFKLFCHLLNLRIEKELKETPDIILSRDFSTRNIFKETANEAGIDPNIFSSDYYMTISKNFVYLKKEQNGTWIQLYP